MSFSVEFDFIILIIRKENEFLTRLEDILDKNYSPIKVKYNSLPTNCYRKTVKLISKNLIIKNQWRSE